MWLVKRFVSEFLYYCDNLQLIFVLDARLRGTDGWGAFLGLPEAEAPGASVRIDGNSRNAIIEAGRWPS